MPTTHCVHEREAGTASAVKSHADTVVEAGQPHLFEDALGNENLLLGRRIWQRSQCEQDSDRLSDVACGMVCVHVSHVDALEREVEQRGGGRLGVGQQRVDVLGRAVSQRALARVKHARQPAARQPVLLRSDREHVENGLSVGGVAQLGAVCGGSSGGRFRLQRQLLHCLHGGLHPIAPPLQLHESDAQLILLCLGRHVFAEQSGARQRLLLRGDGCLAEHLLHGLQAAAAHSRNGVARHNVRKLKVEGAENVNTGARGRRKQQ